jgi:hypothetical protein
METRKIVLRWAPGSNWYIAYAASYAPAFRSAVNSFPEWSDALRFVGEYNRRPNRDCDMVFEYHHWDQLRAPMTEAEFYQQ